MYTVLQYCSTHALSRPAPTYWKAKELATQQPQGGVLHQSLIKDEFGVIITIYDNLAGVLTKTYTRYSHD